MEALLRPECVVLDPGVQPLQVPPPGSPALPYLVVYEGLQCLECPYVCLAINAMKGHISKSPLHSKGRRGAQPLALRSEPSAAQRWQHVACQRLFVTGRNSISFRVARPTRDENGTLGEPTTATTLTTTGRVLTMEEAMRLQLDKELEQDKKDTEIFFQKIPNNATKTEVSPWLEMTRWPKYLQGHGFAKVAPLGANAQQDAEPLLVEFTRSIDRVI